MHKQQPHRGALSDSTNTPRLRHFAHGLTCNATPPATRHASASSPKHIASQPQDLNAQPTGERINRAHACCRPWPWQSSLDTRRPDCQVTLLPSLPSQPRLPLARPRESTLKQQNRCTTCICSSHRTYPLLTFLTPSSSDLQPPKPLHTPPRARNSAPSHFISSYSRRSIFSQAERNP